MKQYELLKEINRKQIMQEELTTAEKREAVSVFLDGVRSSEEIYAFKKRMRVNPETDSTYPGFFIPPFPDKKKQRLIQGYLPKTNIVYTNHYELESLRLLQMLEPESERVQHMVAQTLRRLQDTCFGNFCHQGECTIASISVLRFLTAMQPRDPEWIGRLVAPLGECFKNFGKGQAAVQQEVPVSYLLMAFTDLNNEVTREVISFKQDWLLGLLRRPWITGTLSNGKVSEMDTYNVLFKYIIRNALGTLPEFSDIGKCRIYVDPDDERCYCDI